MFLQQQTLISAITFPEGTTETDLGTAQSVDFEELSVLIDNVELNQEQLDDRDVVLNTILGVFIVTDSDRLHIGFGSETERPASVPLDFSYTRALEDETVVDEVRSITLGGG